jgi:hypothetical protein
MRLRTLLGKSLVALLLASGATLGLSANQEAATAQPDMNNAKISNSLHTVQQPESSISPQIAQGAINMSWTSFTRFMENLGEPFVTDMLPHSFPNGFGNGQVALTRLHTGSSAYIVVREGIPLPGLSTVRQQIGKNIMFNSLGAPGSSYDGLPALTDFPTTQYSGSNVIEVIHWAARYDDQALRSRISQSRRETLANGQRAAYIEQDHGRTGWCVLTDESAQYSDFICVNIANSPQTALGTLSLIVSDP